MTDAAFSWYRVAMVKKLTKTETRVLADINVASHLAPDGLVKINTARIASSEFRPRWEYDVSASARTLESLERKHLITQLTLSKKKATCLAVHTGYRCSEGPHGGPFKYTEGKDGIRMYDPVEPNRAGIEIEAFDVNKSYKPYIEGEKTRSVSIPKSQMEFAHDAMDDDGGPITITPVELEVAAYDADYAKELRDKIDKATAIPAKMLKGRKPTASRLHRSEHVEGRTHDKDTPVHMSELAEGYEHLVIPLKKPRRRQRWRSKPSKHNWKNKS